MPPTVYTVGHSNHPIDYFSELLRAHGITCVVDVRSVAASAYNPQYNREPLLTYLKSLGVTYLHFAAEFGARHTDPALHDAGGRVDFDKVRASAAFLSGVDRLKKGLERGYVVSLVCSEADPLDCHRFILIAKYLTENGFDVRHILKNKQAVSHETLEDELLKKYRRKLPQASLFEPNISRQQQLNRAYWLRNQAIGWSATNPESTGNYD